jgi:hypothetical protein
MASAEQGLDRVYRQQFGLLRDRLALESRQALEIEKFLETRKAKERHLRKQMRTTFTPVQQQEVRRLWEQRKRPPTEQERRETRQRLGVSTSQEQQLQSYLEQIAAHRAQTMRELDLYLSADQRTSLKEMSATF